jgi:hypothetical protein
MGGVETTGFYRFNLFSPFGLIDGSGIMGAGEQEEEDSEYEKLCTGFQIHNRHSIPVTPDRIKPP